MVIYYAIGGGLGHLTRARKILNYKNITEFKIITAVANNPIFSKEHTLLLESNLYQSPDIINSLVTDIIIQYKADSLFIDTFPFGILGELDIESLNKLCKTFYVARYIKWDKYRKNIKSKGLFYTSFLFDMTDKQQIDFIKARSQYIETIELPVLKNTKEIELKHPYYWLINHSGNKEEVLELFEYAKEVAHIEQVNPHFIINTQCEMDEIRESNLSVFNLYPASMLYEKAAKIISACGFNVMQETIPYCDKHIFIPFERKYDDQFKRAQYRKNLNIDTSRIQVIKSVFC